MFHVYWPLTAFVTLVIVVSVIMVMLRWGPKLCKTRHTALPDYTLKDWPPQSYEQHISYA